MNTTLHRTTLLMVCVLLLGFSLLLLAACGDQDSAKGGGGGEHKKNASGGSASTNGQIVFRRYLDPDQTKMKNFTMNPDGSHVRQIAPLKGWKDEQPSWSPDGTKVAFMRTRINEYMSRIMVVNPDTGETREVTHCGPDQGWTKEHPPPSGHFCVSDFDPAFSPDGHSIAFRRIIGPDKHCCRIEGIWIIGLDGSNPHQVTNVDPKLPEEFSDFGPAFSPDGKMLVFDRQQTKKAPKLVKLGDEEPYYHAVFVQSLHSSGEPEDAHRITPWKLNCQDRPEYSPDGKLVLFRCLPKGEQGPSNLYWVHPDGTGLHQLTQAAAQKQTYWYGGSSFSPSFSEGEGWIAVGRAPGYGKKGNADVFRVRIEDGEVVRSVNLTKSGKWDSNPSWGTHPPVG
jgi:Tol biopolymer transport system component